MTAQELTDQARMLLQQGRRVCCVEVLHTQGSVPREAGTRMLVTPTSVMGTIGGGHLEFAAIHEARMWLAEQGPNKTLSFALGPSLGQCCGGRVKLSLSPLDADALEQWQAPAPRFHLQLFGAGHVGQAIAELLTRIACQVEWIDERVEEFPEKLLHQAWPAHITRVCVDSLEAEVALAPAGSYYLVMTHDHDLDLRIVEAVMRRHTQQNDVGYLGLIASQTKRQRFLHRLEDKGFTAEVLQRLNAPIGLPGIIGKEPEVIAIAVVAQLLQVAS